MFKKGLMISIILIILLSLLGRYGWKLEGFNACQPTTVEELEILDDKVIIVARDSNLIPRGNIGYIYKQVDDKLYIGARYDSIFGIFETGRFKATIPTTQKVNEVYIQVGNETYLVEL